MHEERVDEIMSALCTSVLCGSEEQRDISSIGLKTVVLEMPSSMATPAIRRLTPSLIKGCVAAHCYHASDCCCV